MIRIQDRAGWNIRRIARCGRPYLVGDKRYLHVRDYLSGRGTPTLVRTRTANPSMIIQPYDWVRKRRRVGRTQMRCTKVEIAKCMVKISPVSWKRTRKRSRKYPPTHTHRYRRKTLETSHANSGVVEEGGVDSLETQQVTSQKCV